jgi:acyl-coenzyme A thioesterase PaaI-like protein
MRVDTLSIWRRLAAVPGGRWAFSRIVCAKAPYFGSIHPRFVELRPEYAEIRMRKRRAVLNHLGSVHAIAMCNMAELAGGTMTEVTIPATHRWIPTGMTVKYLKKATTDLVAIARPAATPDWSSSTVDYPVHVVVQDVAAVPVFEAAITMRVSPRARRGER